MIKFQNNSIFHEFRLVATSKNFQHHHQHHRYFSRSQRIFSEVFQPFSLSWTLFSIYFFSHLSTSEKHSRSLHTQFLSWRRAFHFTEWLDFAQWQPPFSADEKFLRIHPQFSPHILVRLPCFYHSMTRFLLLFAELKINLLSTNLCSNIQSSKYIKGVIRNIMHLNQSRYSTLSRLANTKRCFVAKFYSNQVKLIDAFKLQCSYKRYLSTA